MDQNEVSKGLLAVFVVLCCLAGCSWYNSCEKDRKREERLELKRQDSIRKAFIADSLAHDPHFQDSVRKAKEEYLKWKILHDSISKEDVVGFVLLSSDSCYHTILHPMMTKEDGLEHNISINDISSIRFVTDEEIAVNHYVLCSTCEDYDDVCTRYELGELIEKEE